jgi:predicted Rossmann fold nucleotide-binding protein DprA/Smf involved in DNA uptake
VELEASLSWLALTLTPGIAARLSARLLREYGSPEGVFRASLAGIESCSVPAPVAQAIFKKQMFWRAEKEVAALRKVGGKLVNWKDPEYPQSLLQIYDPPVMLYVRGDAEILNSPSLGIVGTRRPTVYGSHMAERMGRELASRGLTIVSGLARGIRAEPHPYLKAGHRVRVRSGPLAGAQGTLVRRKDKCRLVLSIDLIMRSVAVEVDEDLGSHFKVTYDTGEVAEVSWAFIRELPPSKGS